MTDTLSPSPASPSRTPVSSPAFPARTQGGRRLSGTKVFFITLAAVVLGLFAFLILLIMLIGSIGAMAAAGATESTSDATILEIDLRVPLLDAPVPPTLFADSPASTVGIVRALDRARDDEDVKGVFIRGETGGMAPATAEELRLALLDFRTSGKFVVTHAQGLYSTSVIPYQAISASSDIWLQDGTSVAMAGLYSQTEFFGGVMEKIDAEPDFIRRGAYKTAVNSYTEEGFTAEHRESTESLLTSLFDAAVDNIATDREMSRERLLELFETAPHSARDAREAGLVDTLGYLEEAKEHARELAGDEDAVFKPISDYRPRSNFGKPVIALIEGQGTILPGTSGGDNLFTPATNMGGETLAAGLDAALEDEDVKAVLFRVSSPGGSAPASDQIMAAVERAQAAGKPVVISMGQFAASGGYLISAPADHIVALPQTITGSIGAFGGKVALEGTFDKVGYNLEAIRVGGEFAGAYNIDTPFTEAQRAAYQRMMDQIYDDFLAAVAEGRDMSREAVIQVAEGRVWTGRQALERGLVDELGGFDAALRAAKRLGDIEEDAAVRLKRFPRPKSREELFNDLFSASASTGRDLERLGAVMALPEVQAMLRMRESAQARGSELEAVLPVVR
ncbi:MAG: signal peptide peptidase SppA [Litorimonas sp.]